MTALASAIYVGAVTHARLRPRRHALRYRLYSFLLDLDDLPRLAGASRWFSHNRFNLFSLWDKDFGDGSDTPIRQRVEGHLRAAGLPADGPIRLFAMPRVLGYGFNPISIFFCHDADGALVATFYEVHNTFGERHAYLIPAAPGPDGALRQDCAKEFHVSPFMDMGVRYEFRVWPPAETVRVGITGRDENGPLIVATQTGVRRDWSDAALLRVFFTHPLVTLKVIGGIHWEALRIWLKGVRLRDKPPPPAQFVTAVRPPLNG